MAMKFLAALFTLTATLLIWGEASHAADPVVLSDVGMDQVTAGAAVSDRPTGITPLPEVHFTIVIPLAVTINSNTIAISHSNSSANAVSAPASMDSMSWFVPYTWDARGGLQFGTSLSNW